MSKIIAFDFDGVICDGLAEYFYSATLAYEKALQIYPNQTSLESIRQAFYELRPVIETGWEMVALIHALLTGYQTHDIWQDWRSPLNDILETLGTDKNELMIALDAVRDRQISETLDHWLSLHCFYAGMTNCLNQLLADQATEIYIITTKEARFTHQLLIQQGIDFPRVNIFGKEVKQPKAQTLKQLAAKDSSQFWFIEDRLKTLEQVRQNPDLDHLELFLATWGYNRSTDAENLADKNITPVDLALWQTKITAFLTSSV